MLRFLKEVSFFNFSVLSSLRFFGFVFPSLYSSFPSLRSQSLFSSKYPNHLSEINTVFYRNIFYSNGLNYFIMRKYGGKAKL